MISIVGANSHIELITNHFGINPVNGGIPLSDNSIIGISSCIIGVIVLSLLNWLILIWLVKWSIINRGIIIRQYMVK